MIYFQSWTINNNNPPTRTFNPVTHTQTPYIAPTPIMSPCTRQQIHYLKFIVTASLHTGSPLPGIYTFVNSSEWFMGWNNWHIYHVWCAVAGGANLAWHKALHWHLGGRVPLFSPQLTVLGTNTASARALIELWNTVAAWVAVNYRDPGTCVRVHIYVRTKHHQVYK